MSEQYEHPPVGVPPTGGSADAHLQPSADGSAQQPAPQVQRPSGRGRYVSIADLPENDPLRRLAQNKPPVPESKPKAKKDSAKKATAKASEPRRFNLKVILIIGAIAALFLILWFTGYFKANP
jgi:hypothetical protein